MPFEKPPVPFVTALEESLDDDLHLSYCGKWRCERKSYDELKAEMEAMQQQMVEAKRNERANALKEVKRLCKEFGFTAGMLKGVLAEGRKKQL